MTKTMWRIVPLILLAYLMAYMDRVNISFASLQMNNDLKFSASIYGLGAGLFFLAYALRASAHCGSTSFPVPSASEQLRETGEVFSAGSGQPTQTVFPAPGTATANRAGHPCRRAQP